MLEVARGADGYDLFGLLLLEEALVDYPLVFGQRFPAVFAILQAQNCLLFCLFGDGWQVQAGLETGLASRTD